MSKGVAIVILFFSLVILGIAVVIAWRGYQKHEVNTEVSQDIRALQEEAERLERETTRLSERIEYLQTPEFQEKQAKDKLGLARPDEKLVIIKPSPYTHRNESEESEGIMEHAPIMKKPNYIQWWEYLFK